MKEEQLKEIKAELRDLKLILANLKPQMQLEN